MDVETAGALGGDRESPEQEEELQQLVVVGNKAPAHFGNESPENSPEAHHAKSKPSPTLPRQEVAQHYVRGSSRLRPNFMGATVVL